MAAAARVVARCCRYFGWWRNVRSPGPADSMGATPVTSALPSPSRVHPRARAKASSRMTRPLLLPVIGRQDLVGQVSPLACIDDARLRLQDERVLLLLPVGHDQLPDLPEYLVEQLRLPLLQVPIEVLEEPAQVPDLPIDRLLPLPPGRLAQDRSLLLEICLHLLDFLLLRPDLLLLGVPLLLQLRLGLLPLGGFVQDLLDVQEADLQGILLCRRESGGSQHSQRRQARRHASPPLSPHAPPPGPPPPPQTHPRRT